MSKKRKVGADLWLEKDSYREGTKQHKKELKERPKRIKKHKAERAMNGYSWDDWINFDSFIAGIVANAVLEFAEKGVGYFPIGGEKMDQTTYDYPNGTHENFVATCGAIYFALTNWLDWDLVGQCEELGNKAAWDAELVVQGEAVEAMILFAEYLPCWWD